MIQLPPCRKPRITSRIHHTREWVLIRVVIRIEIGSKLHSFVSVIFLIFVIWDLSGYSFLFVAACYMGCIAEWWVQVAFLDFIRDVLDLEKYTLHSLLRPDGWYLDFILTGNKFTNFQLSLTHGLRTGHLLLNQTRQFIKFFNPRTPRYRLLQISQPLYLLLNLHIIFMILVNKLNFQLLLEIFNYLFFLLF